MITGRKRSRLSSSRSRILDEVPLLQKAWDPAHRYHLLILFFFTVAYAATATLGPPAPLVARAGQRPAHDLTSRAAFAFHDEADTAGRKEEAARNAPPVFLWERNWISPLADELKQMLAAVADAETFSALDPGIVSLWGLSEGTHTTLRGDLIEEQLKEKLPALAGELETALRKAWICAPEGIDLNRFNVTSGLAVSREPERREILSLYLIQPLSAHREWFRSVRGPIPAIFPRCSDAFHQALAELLVPRLQATLKYDPLETDRNRERTRSEIRPTERAIRKGETLLRGHEIAQTHHLPLFREEARQHHLQMTPAERGEAILGGSLLVLLITITAAFYLANFRYEDIRPLPRAFGLGCLVLIPVVFARMIPRLGWSPAMIPLAFTSMAITIAFNQRMAMTMTVFTTLLIGISLQQPTILFSLLLGSFGAIFLAAQIRRRTTLIRAGLVTGLVQFLGIIGFHLHAHIGLEHALADALAGLASGIGIGLAITLLLPLIEQIFRVTTDIRLLELSDFNRSILRKLMIEAPGTSHHSLMVANLSEAAAEAIGANALLVKVCSYYHDIGKLNKPEYFIENTPGDFSRHANLSPSMSALIILAHPKDGVELAQKHKLPKPILDAIRQHHGTGRVEYFYRKALAKHALTEQDAQIDFRYEGPKPQYKEMGILMLADSCEAACRVLEETSPSRIDGLVKEVVQEKIDDGQLDECGITFAELAAVQRRLVRGLTSAHHSRITQPPSEPPHGHWTAKIQLPNKT
jgi:putative nucleotidyltransferase with HDIG domain